MKIDLAIQKTTVSAQRIDDFAQKTYDISLVMFSILNILRRVKFFDKKFLFDQY